MSIGFTVRGTNPFVRVCFLFFLFAVNEPHPRYTSYNRGLFTLWVRFVHSALIFPIPLGGMLKFRIMQKTNYILFDIF